MIKLNDQNLRVLADVKSHQTTQDNRHNIHATPNSALPALYPKTKSSNRVYDIELNTQWASRLVLRRFSKRVVINFLVKP